jgi:alkylhydroperoxidase family enzyme
VSEARQPDPFCKVPVPRLPGVPELDSELQDRIDRGADPLETRQMGWVPEAYKRFLHLQSYLRWKGGVDPRVKEMARLRIARLNNCHY